MLSLSRHPLLHAFTLLFPLLVAACGGGGGGSGTPGGTGVTPQDNTDGTARMLSFAADIEPIMQGKCLGCHNSGPNPLAPFSLEGEAAVSSFKSAMHFVIDGGTMPPAGVAQLSTEERNKFIAWLTESPYSPGGNKTRIALIAAQAWETTPGNRDSFLDHRPAQVDCPRDMGWLVEDDELEVRTEFCNYLSVTQQSLLNLPAGTELELALSHSDLDFNAPASAHLAVAIAGNTVWTTDIPIPNESGVIRKNITVPFAVSAGDPIELHLHNHGQNAWSLHAIDALVPEDLELDYCASYENTWDAIREVVFEQAGCANSVCHGEAASGGLDLRPEVAYDNLVGVTAQASSLRLIFPREPDKSFLYHKLSAKTFPGSYAVGGSPMPSAGAAISAGQLEAIRLWIEAGAPETGSTGDTIGRGEDEIERLLGVCLPEADAVNTVPLPPPERGVGVQFTMPPHDVPAESETEWCFAAYYDFRDQIPPEYMSADREFFYIRGDEVREDPYTHHNVLIPADVPVEQIHDPAYGAWTCAGGEQAGELCEPTDLQSCGAGKCRSEMQHNVACIGYGPPSNTPIASAGSNVGSILTKEGYYETVPTHGIFYWNSHAFNLTTEDANHHVWRNLFFTGDRRYHANYITFSRNIDAGAGTPPFERQTVCRDYKLDQGDGLLFLTSHTHKRGEHFTISVKGGEQLYETYSYDEPLQKFFEPALVFNSAEQADRILEYCATYNNGLNANGTPNLDKVTRASRRPDNAEPCQPVACVAGKVGAPCGGVDDNASCDSAPGAGDGWCDACAITSGISSDDEMFILIGATLPDYDATVEK